MEQISFDVPESMISWIDSLVAGGRYASASDYLSDLVRRDQESEHDDVE